MNQLMLTAALRGVTMIVSGILVGKGIATSAEVNNAADQLTTIGSGAIGLGTLLYSVYTRFASKQAAMTNTLPNLVQPAIVAKKK